MPRPPDDEVMQTFLQDLRKRPQGQTAAEQAEAAAQRRLQAVRERASADRDKSVQDLRALLVRKYGSLVRAWRQLLDKDGNGRLGESEFHQACRSIGFGRSRGAWDGMCEGGNGPLELKALDPDGAYALERFRTCVLHRYGSFERAFQSWDADGNHVVTLHEFTVACNEVGFVGNARKLFGYLDTDGSGVLSFDEMDAHAAEALFGRIQVPKHDLVLGASRTTAASRLNEQLGREIRQDQADRAKERQRALVGAKTKEEFKQLLIRRCGSLVRAWRTVLDADGNGRLGENEFYEACRCVGYAGSAKALWKDFKPEKGLLHLSNIDPAAAGALQEFRRATEDRFGSWENAFEAWDANGDNTVSVNEFVMACDSMGFIGNPKKLFNDLDTDGSGTLALEELDQKSAVALFGRSAERTYQDRERKPKELFSVEEKPPRDVILDFRHWLLARFGSLARAWYEHFDPKCVGRQSQREFFQRCRLAGWYQDLNAVWKRLDPDQSCVLYYAEFDPSGYQALFAFYQAVLRAHGTLEEAFASWPEAKAGRRKLPDGLDSVVRGVLDTEGGGEVALLALQQCARLLLARPPGKRGRPGSPKRRPQSADFVARTNFRNSARRWQPPATRAGGPRPATASRVRNLRQHIAYGRANAEA